MRQARGMLTGLLLAGVVVTFVSFTRGKDDTAPKKPKPTVEEERLRKAVERASKPVETERDHFVSALANVPLPEVRTDGSEAERWFAQLSGGQAEWRGDLTPKPLRELYERVAGQLGIRMGAISRAQFRQYAAQYLGAGQSRPWKQASKSKDLEKAFLEQDQNGDGVLEADEMSLILQGERQRWDRNGNAVIDLNEYSDYFATRTQQTLEQNRSLAKPTAPMPPVLPLTLMPLRPTPPVPTLPGATKPIEPRPALAASGLPDWFTRLDTDHDSQIGLYEWKAADQGVSTFVGIDENDDGLLTAVEVRHYLQTHPMLEIAATAVRTAIPGMKPVKDR